MDFARYWQDCVGQDREALRGWFWPDARIIWAYGLCGTGMTQHVRRAVERRRAEGDDRVAFLALDDCNGSVGSRTHPSRASHVRAAAQIAEAVDRL